MLFSKNNLAILKNVKDVTYTPQSGQPAQPAELLIPSCRCLLDATVQPSSPVGDFKRLISDSRGADLKRLGDAIQTPFQ